MSRLTFLAAELRRRIGADPQADFDRPITEQAAPSFIEILGIGAHEL
ncbi:MAG: hypothetical protein WBW81_04130 [Methylocella sp.]